MDDSLPQKLKAAFLECLNCCTKSQSPLVALAEYTLRLRRDPNWTDPEVDRVGQAVLKRIHITSFDSLHGAVLAPAARPGGIRRLR
jgi:hypothetical protein